MNADRHETHLENFLILIFRVESNQVFYLKRYSNSTMTTLSELRACKSCGNVFTKKAGVVIINSCPQCDGTSFDIISANEEIIDG